MARVFFSKVQYRVLNVLTPLECILRTVPTDNHQLQIYRSHHFNSVLAFQHNAVELSSGILLWFSLYPEFPDIELGGSIPGRFHQPCFHHKSSPHH